jgi:hypothetical protein
MDRMECLIRRKQHDQPLDLPPAAEMDDIAEIAAAVRARGGLAGSEIAKPRDQLGSLGRGGAVGQMNVIFQRFPRIFLILQALADPPFQMTDQHAQQAVNQADFAGSARPPVRRSAK